MANSRELVECIASALSRPLTEVVGRMRHLREAGLVTTGGRGVTAPAMTAEDAASLICSLYGSEFVKDGVDSVTALKKLPGISQGIRRPRWQDDRNRPYLWPQDLLRLEPGHNAVNGLATVLRLFQHEDAFRQRVSRSAGDVPFELRARFSLQFPEHFASLTVGVPGQFAAMWTYGRKGQPRTRQTRECDQHGLREVAHCLRSS